MEVTPLTEMMSRVENTDDPNTTAGLDGVDEQLITSSSTEPGPGGLQLTSEGGVLQQLTNRLPESTLDGEITNHLGYDKHDPRRPQHPATPATAPAPRPS
jgi:hypothetical protein